jgi:hypothetical protein
VEYNYNMLLAQDYTLAAALLVASNSLWALLMSVCCDVAVMILATEMAVLGVGANFAYLEA